LLAVLLSLVAVPSHAAPDDGILLRGSRSGWVDLYVYVNRTISPADLRLETKGSYVGFFLSPAPANRDTVGALVMPRVGATGSDASSIARLGESWDVRAGKYRMFLLTDGPAEVFVPIDGQGFRGWTPRGRAPVSIRGADFEVAPGSAGNSNEVPVRLDARSLVVSAAEVTSSSLTAVEGISACVAESATCVSDSASSARLPLDTAWSFGAQLVPPGVYTGKFQVSRFVGGDDAASYVAGIVLVLTIGKQT
jgi:hypothetical protein